MGFYEKSKKYLANLVDKPIYNSYVWNNLSGHETKAPSLAEEADMAQENLEKSWKDPSFSKNTFDISIDLSKRDIQDYELGEDEDGYREQIANKFLEYYVDDSMDVMDFICRNGKISQMLASHVNTIDCIDWGDAAIETSQAALADHSNASVYDARIGYHYGNEETKENAAVVFNPIRLPELEFIEKKYDFIYSYNAFKFFNIYSVYHYLGKFSSLLKPGGKIWINAHLDIHIEENSTIFGDNYQYYKNDVYSNNGRIIEFINTKALNVLCSYTGLDVEEINEWGECVFVKRG